MWVNVSLVQEAQLDDPAFYSSDPHPVFARLRTETPVFWNEGTGFWALSRYKDIRYVFRHPELFSSEYGTELADWKSDRKVLFRFRADDPLPPPGAKNLITTDPPLHRAYKAMGLGTGLFSRSSADSIEPRVRATVREIMDKVRRGVSGEVDEVLAAPVAVSSLAQFLGLSEADYPRIKGWTDIIQHAASGTATEVELHEASEAVREMWSYLAAHLSAVHDQGGGLSSLAAARTRTEVISSDSLIAFACDLLVAGNETTRTAITGGIVALCEHPREWAKITDNPELIPDAVEEILRWVTPVSTLGRVAVDDTEIRNHPIRKGDRVLLLLASADRDEDVWRDPDRLDVARGSKPGHVAFGHGAHLCVGAALARTEIRVLLEEMVGSGISFQLEGRPTRQPGFNAAATYATARVVFAR